MKIFEFTNCVDLDEVVQNELPHLDLHSSLSTLGFSVCIAWIKYFLKF